MISMTNYITYFEKKTGASLTFGRWLSEYVNGSISLVAEQLNFSDPTADAPELILQQLGTQSTTGFRTMLARDTRDYFMIHDLDMVLSFNPGAVEEVRAAGVPVLSSTIDIANARIQFANGCVANLTASRVSTNKMRRLRLFQRDNYLSIDFHTRQGMICRREAGTGVRPSIVIEQLRGSEEEPLKLQLESFLTAVAAGNRPVVSGEDGAAALDLAHRVLEAIDRFVGRNQVESSQPVSRL